MTTTEFDTTSPIREVRWLAVLTWHECRPVVQVIFALRFLTGVILVGGVAAVARPAVLCGLASWMCVVAAIYLRNGVADVVEDRRNGSARPIASGALPAETAHAQANALAVAGIVVALLPAPRLTFVLAVLAMLALGWAYSAGPSPLKRTMPGFLLCVVGGGALTYTAGVLVSGAAPTAEAVCAGLALSAWMGLAGATKDLSDVAGDRLAGRRTLPVLFGYRAAASLTAAGTLAAGSGFVVAALCWTPELLPAALALAAGAASITALLIRGARAETGPGRQPYRTFMATQYVVHLLLLIYFAIISG